MKTAQLLIVAIFFLSLNGLSQEKEAKFLQFNNFSSNFEVPEGKTWVINSIFSSSIGEIIENSDGTISTLPVRIFIKTLNGDIKTDYAGNRFGPQVYQSDNTAASVSYPITLPENTKFSLVIVVGNPGNCKAFNGTGYINLYEVTNNTF
ncbi:MAG: hypothetical protein HUJ25_06505 [Crocinitomicaceae bacterium]|nr:hypothetical protein [Crocinitomicaceae bacterium]